MRTNPGRVLGRQPGQSGTPGPTLGRSSLRHPPMTRLARCPSASPLRGPHRARRRWRLSRGTRRRLPTPSSADLRVQDRARQGEQTPDKLDECAGRSTAPAGSGEPRAVKMMRSRTWGGYGARCPGLKSKPREVPPLQNEAGIPVGGIPSCPVLTSAYSERARWSEAVQASKSRDRKQGQSRAGRSGRSSVYRPD